MAAGTLKAFDALGASRDFAVEVDLAGVVTPHHVIEVDGLPVGAGKALPVIDAGSVAALGAPADAAWTTGAGSLVSLLKTIASALATIVTNTAALLTGTPVRSSGLTISHTVVALTATDSPVIAANANRKYLAIVNIGTGLATITFGASAAVAGSGWPMTAAAAAGDQGGALLYDGVGCTQQAIHGICASGVTTNLVVLEGV